MIDYSQIGKGVITVKKAKTGSWLPGNPRVTEKSSCPGDEAKECFCFCFKEESFQINPLWEKKKKNPTLFLELNQAGIYDIGPC